MYHWKEGDTLQMQYVSTTAANSVEYVIGMVFLGNKSKLSVVGDSNTIFRTCHYFVFCHLVAAAIL